MHRQTLTAFQPPSHPSPHILLGVFINLSNLKFTARYRTGSKRAKLRPWMGRMVTLVTPLSMKAQRQHPKESIECEPHNEMTFEIYLINVVKLLISVTPPLASHGIQRTKFKNNLTVTPLKVTPSGKSQGLFLRCIHPFTLSLWPTRPWPIGSCTYLQDLSNTCVLCLFVNHFMKPYMFCYVFV